MFLNSTSSIQLGTTTYSDSWLFHHLGYLQVFHHLGLHVSPVLKKLHRDSWYACMLLFRDLSALGNTSIVPYSYVYIYYLKFGVFKVWRFLHTYVFVFEDGYLLHLTTYKVSSTYVGKFTSCKAICETVKVLTLNFPIYFT